MTIRPLIALRWFAQTAVLLLFSALLLVACEVDVRLGTFAAPCDGLTCGDPCGDVGDQWCSAEGECTTYPPYCPEPECVGVPCGDLCTLSDGLSGYCNSDGVCGAEFPFCSCLGYPCGSPCWPECNDVGTTTVCPDQTTLYHCQPDGRCLDVKPTCPEAGCGVSPVCEGGEYCCNESCGTCSPIGAWCDSWWCGEGTIPCGPSVSGCFAGEYCCDPLCGGCALPGSPCPTTGSCSDAFTVCGDNVCGPGSVCCNPSCGICAGPGEACPLDTCEAELDCGDTRCDDGEYCCNESCSICVPEGGECPQVSCL